MKYSELQVTSNFSFLRGASHPEEFVEQAAIYEYAAIAITDRNSLAGVVRAHVAAKKFNIKLIVGCRLDLKDGPSLLAYPMHKDAYSNLTNLLTTGNRRAEKGECTLYKDDVYAYAKGMKLIVIPPSILDSTFEFEKGFIETLQAYKENFGDDLYVAATKLYRGDDAKVLFQLSKVNLRMVATNDVHYHHPKRRELQDIVTCIREKCTIYTAGYKLYANAERYLKPGEEMVRLFRQYPDAIDAGQEIAEACLFSLDSLKYEYPLELTNDNRTPQEELTKLVWEGAKEIFGEVSEKTKATILHELDFIEKMNYASYFLTVHDLVRFAKEKEILCQGRGSAANSTVCFCLGITSVNPEKFDLLFERFISAARNEPPDIDVDFEHERREEVIQYIYSKYGRDRAAIVATVTQQHQKGAIRDVAKVMGLSVDSVNKLSGSVGEFTSPGFEAARIFENGFSEGDRHLMKVIELTQQFMGFPRQLGQHTGGFVITRDKLSDLIPIMNARMENRTCIEWNKDDIDALGFLKIDVLALGMLTCIRKNFELIKKHYQVQLTLATVPQDDPAVYEMICKADTIGVFQIESRAQQSMLPRLKPKTFYDLVIEVAIVRPGPIQGDMVHPYLRRRNGEEPVEYPSKELEEILGRTLGIPLFQEQVMKIAIVAAGFTPAEADLLRRSMATFRVQGLVSKFERKLIDGMLERGYPQVYAERIFRQLEGFGSYGFPESHAASFASLVYVSSWLKCYYPDVFACALLNSMPMGFYQPAQIVMDAQKHGVNVKGVDINYSQWDNTLEDKDGNYFVMRLGFRQVKGIREDEIKKIITLRTDQFESIASLRNTGTSDALLKLLADADAFRSIGLDRREALWEISKMDSPKGIFNNQHETDPNEKLIQLPVMQLPEHVVHDYGSTRLSLKAHPLSFIREKLCLLHVSASNELLKLKDGENVKVAGLVLVRQRPGTAKGVCFITIEDEFSFVNLVVFENIFNEYRNIILQSTVLMVEGRLQIEGEVVHVIVSQCYNISKLLRKLSSNADDQSSLLTVSRADQRPDSPVLDFPKGRDFK